MGLTQDQINAAQAVQTTGVVDGGEVTIASSTTIDITAGQGVIADHTIMPFDIDIVTWNEELGVDLTTLPGADLTQGIIYICKGPDGETMAYSTNDTPFSSVQYRTDILLAVIRTTWQIGETTNEIRGISNLRTPTTGPVLTTRDFNPDVFLVKSGGSTFESDPSVNLQFKHTDAEIAGMGLNFTTDHNSPNVHTLAASINPVDFRSISQDGETTGTLITDPDNGFYDLNGTLTAVLSNQYSVMRLWVDPSSSPLYFLQYGTAVYNNAEIDSREYNTENPPAPALLSEFAFVLASLIVNGTTTDWDGDARQEIFFGDVTGGTVTGGGGGAAALNDLTDVTITSQAIGDILIADSTSSWINLAAGTSGFVLTSNGAGTEPTWQAVAGSGTITKTGTSPDNSITRWDGVDTTVIQGSGIIIDDSDNVSGVGNIQLDSIEIVNAGLAENPIVTAQTATFVTELQVTSLVDIMQLVIEKDATITDNFAMAAWVFRAQDDATVQRDWAGMTGYMRSGAGSLEGAVSIEALTGGSLDNYLEFNRSTVVEGVTVATRPFMISNTLDSSYLRTEGTVASQGVFRMADGDFVSWGNGSHDSLFTYTATQDFEFRTTNTIGETSLALVNTASAVVDTDRNALYFYATNDGAAVVEYGRIIVETQTIDAGTHDGAMKFFVNKGGGPVEYFGLNEGDLDLIALYKNLNVNGNNVLMDTGIITFGTDKSIQANGLNMLYDTPTSGAHQIRVNDTPVLTIGSQVDVAVELNLGGNTLQEAVIGNLVSGIVNGNIATGADITVDKLKESTTAYQVLRTNSTPDATEWFTEQATIQFIIDGGGSAITTGEKGDLEIPFDCEIVQVTMLAETSTTTVVDIWVDTYAAYPPADGNSITASAEPTITTAIKSQDATLTGWTTVLSQGDTIRYNVDSNDNATRVTISLLVNKRG